MSTVPNRGVRVRLVPKPDQSDRVVSALRELTPTLAARQRPSRGRAEETLRRTFSLGMTSLVTSLNVVEGTASPAAVESIFQTKLVEKTIPASDGFFSSVTEKFLKPEGELQVPDALRDVVEFAYIPTPPRYFAPSFVPPNTSNYHLRIEDVVRAIQAYPCHRRGWTGRGVRIAMADTGFGRHPIFDAYGFNMHRVHTPSTQHPAVDESGHGTGECLNVLATAPDCTFFGVKHNDFSAEALETSLDQSPKILTNSWGWDVDNRSAEQLKADDPNLYNEFRDVERILLDAIESGVIVVFAGGNGQRPFPACIPQVIAVGGVTVLADGSLRASNYASSFESRLFPGRRIPDICGVVGEAGNAPQEGHIMLPVPHGSKLEGENISRANDRNKGWGVFSGTSAAAPQVAGVIALMLSVHPDLTQSQVLGILSDTANDVLDGKSFMDEPADVGVDFATGPGFVNAFAACLRAEQLRSR